MNRTFTLKYLHYFIKAIMVMVVVCSTAILQPNIANTGSLNDGIDIQAKSIKCYPNPAVSFVNFDVPAEYISKNYLIQVYSFTGKKLYESGITNTKLTVTFTSEFYRGIYVYQLRDKNGKILETGKFQVSR